MTEKQSVLKAAFGVFFGILLYKLASLFCNLIWLCMLFMAMIAIAIAVAFMIG